MMGCIRVGTRVRRGQVSCATALVFALVFGGIFACEEEAPTPAGTSGAGAGAGTGGDGGSGGADADGDAVGEGGPGGDCTADPADDECTACLKLNCCDQWEECGSDQACTTCAECLATEGDLESCNYTADKCLFEAPADPTAQLLLCGLPACEVECGY